LHLSFKFKLMNSTMLLPGATAVLLVPPLILWVFKGSNSRQCEEAWELFWFSLMFVIFSVYPSVSRIILSTYSCLNLGTDGNDRPSSTSLPPSLHPSIHPSIHSSSIILFRETTAKMPKFEQPFSLFSMSLSPSLSGYFMLSDFREECPLANKTSFAYIWSIIATIFIPVGCLLFIAWILVRNGIPELAWKKREKAQLKAVFEVGDG
jgi:hypothetical protein